MEPANQMDNSGETSKDLKEQNEFLKMKMMLERGAEFYSGNASASFTPEIEHLFLSSVMEFERQFDEQKTIKIYDKIGQPTHFQPVDTISDEEIDQAWQRLSKYLYQHGICLEACSPNIGNRELYRFTTEEFFYEEITDMKMPGMIQGFIYDEFHPDHAYENSKMVVDYCIGKLFSKNKFPYQHIFQQDNLRLNNHFPLTEEQFMQMIQSFQDAYEDFIDLVVSEVTCRIEEDVSYVDGEYTVNAIIPGEVLSLSGHWQVGVSFDRKRGFWYINSIQVDSIKF